MKGKPKKWTARRIKELRMLYGERQEQFCIRVGLTLSALRWWEQGKGKPSGSARLLLDRLEEDLVNDRVRELECSDA